MIISIMFQNKCGTWKYITQYAWCWEGLKNNNNKKRLSNKNTSLVYNIILFITDCLIPLLKQYNISFSLVSGHTIIHNIACRKKNYLLRTSEPDKFQHLQYKLVPYIVLTSVFNFCKYAHWQLF